MQFKDRRLSRRLSQTELAKMIGTSQSAISDFELGTTQPTIGLMTRVAEALDFEIVLKSIDVKDNLDTDCVTELRLIRKLLEEKL
jgi:transcriptional regulator with XRE-family HTH domain